jgi:hypothetical protein
MLEADKGVQRIEMSRTKPHDSNVFIGITPFLFLGAAQLQQQ